MQKNVGNAERVIRVLAGLGILSLVFILEGNIRFIGLHGIVPILTGSTGICPLYTVLGISTIKKPKS
jgi:hypothetical protein